MKKISFGIILVLAFGLTACKKSDFLDKKESVITKENNQSQKDNKEKILVCTQEVKMCPDGSAVSRKGPNCEFAECSEIKTKPCTKELRPVCGQINSEEKTFNNKCLAKNANAKILYKGKCKDDNNDAKKEKLNKFA